MHGWDGEFDIKCETEFRAQGKRLGKQLFDVFPSAFDNQKGFISAKSEIVCKVQGCRVRSAKVMPLKGTQDMLWKMEEMANKEMALATVFLEFCFRSLRTLALLVSILSLLKVATCVNCSVHEYVCTSIGSGVTFPSFCPITAAGFQNRCVWRSHENTTMHIGKTSKNVLVGKLR